MTLTNLVNAALRKLGVLPTGASLVAGAPQLTDALDTVNNLLDNWGADKLMAISVFINGYALQPNTGTYLIGPGQTFNVARPAAIEAAAVNLQNGITMPVRVLNAKEWADLPDRSAYAHLVEYLFYDRALTIGKVFVSPVPIVAANLELTTWLQISKFGDFTTDNPIQPGYARLLELATAIELAPEYPAARVSDQLMKDYLEAMAAIRNLNASLLGQDPVEVQAGAVAA